MSGYRTCRLLRTPTRWRRILAATESTSRSRQARRLRACTAALGYTRIPTNRRNAPGRAPVARRWPAPTAMRGIAGARPLFRDGVPALIAGNRAVVLPDPRSRYVASGVLAAPLSAFEGLMSYGQRLGDSYRRTATYVDEIHKGAKPADLPVQQPKNPS